MSFRRSKSMTDRLLDTAGSFSFVGNGLSRSKVMKASLVAGGVAAVTAASAAISSIRRRAEGRDT